MGALIRHIAVISQSAAIPLAEVTKAAAAVQKQVARDYTPIWNLAATVNAFGSLEEVPVDYWPVIIDDIAEDMGGFHTDQSGQPVAMVTAAPGWTLAVSHECLEMLTDPFGNLTIAGDAPPQALDPLSSLARVNYLVEICDPCEDPAFAYTVNGVEVSDFLTPDYYSPASGSCARYSYARNVTEPHGVLDGGYVSFSDPIADHWYQVRVESGDIQNWDLGSWKPEGQSLRERIDGTSRSIAARQGKARCGGRWAAVDPAVERTACARALSLRGIGKGRRSLRAGPGS